MGKPLATPQSCHFRLLGTQSCRSLDRRDCRFQSVSIQKTTLGPRVAAGDQRILDWVGCLQYWNRGAGRLFLRRCWLNSHIRIRWPRHGQRYQNESTFSSCGLWLRLGQEQRHQDEVADQQQRLQCFSICCTLKLRSGRHTYGSNQST